MFQYAYLPAGSSNEELRWLSILLLEELSEGLEAVALGPSDLREIQYRRAVVGSHGNAETRDSLVDIS